MDVTSATPAVERQRAASPRAVYVLFFFSGFPALIYQIVWQRALFTIYGVNTESVTVVVAAFMLGLGAGSLAGGWLSARRGAPLLAIFGAAELGIAAFGIASLPLFHRIAVWTGGASILQTGLLAFALVLVPTVLMGGTLPLLVEHSVRIYRNVGRSVGLLYAVNTLGSAVACFVTAKLLMRHLGMSGSVGFAAAVNVVIGFLVLALHFRSSRREPAPDFQTAGAPAKQLIPFPAALAVAMAAGFISLSYEIVWYRVYAFVSGGEAKSFAYLLGFFLTGIALGSVWSERVCKRGEGARKPYFVETIACLAAVSNLVGFVAIPAIARIVPHARYAYTFPLVMLCAAALGAIFPLVSHVAVPPDERAGARLSYLYLSNILGSVAGTLLTGFVLMEIWPLSRISVGIVLLGLLLSASLFLSVARGGAYRAVLLAGFTAVTIAVISGSPALFDGVYERLQLKSQFRPGTRFKYIVENRTGVITVDAQDKIYGGGMYDGVFNTDLVHDANLIFRAFAVPALHPQPRRALSIGLSSGSWCQVLASHPAVEKLTIVEINPAYTALIARYPAVASLLRNPKVEIVIDDGRRWLVHHPERKFDLIVSNTTYNWRAHITNLLSLEFLEIVRRHLAPGGVHYYNTTGSAEVERTAVEAFPHVVRVARFLAVSDSPLHPDPDRWLQVISAYRIDGLPVLDPSLPQQQRRLEELQAMFGHVEPPVDAASLSIEYADGIRRRTAGARIVTDDNMGTEWLR